MAKNGSVRQGNFPVIRLLLMLFTVIYSNKHNRNQQSELFGQGNATGYDTGTLPQVFKLMHCKKGFVIRCCQCVANGQDLLLV